MTGTRIESFPRHPQSVGAARRFVAAVLDGHPACADAVLLTSELVTNAYLHGDGTIMVAITACADRVHVSVLDDGTDGVPYWQPPGAAENGRGLPIVDALAWRWGFLREPEGTSAWFELPGGEQAGADSARHAARDATARPRAGSQGAVPPEAAGCTVVSPAA
jgi:anti-sigma regulatory factor (Ser/Thr protein kinase)